MAATTLKAAGDAIVANAAAIGVTTSLTTANITAVGNFLIEASRTPLATVILKLLNSTELNRA